MEIRRGSVWWWKGPTTDREHIQSGTRPVVVVSNEVCNNSSDVITIVPFTTRVKKAYPQQVPVLFSGGVSIALADQITSIPVSELGMHIGDLYTFQMDQIDRAIALQLGYIKVENRPYAPIFRAVEE